MNETLVSGDGWVTARLPDDAQVVSPGISLPLPPAEDLSAEVDRALEEPLDTPPLRELARGRRRVVVAFDDPTVPCYAPLWSTAVPAVLRTLAEAGVPEDGVSLLCANALHRKFTLEELGAILGADLVGSFAARGAIACHDGERDCVPVGTTERGEPVDLSRAAVDADLVVYVNASTTRGFSGGWKSIAVGLSSYRSIATHHTPDTMSMTTEKNLMHESLDRMGEVIERELGADRFFKVETILSNPLQVHRVLGGSIGATRREVLEVTRANLPPRRDLLPEKVDVVLYGVPDWSPYAAFSFLNPILTMISTGLGYLGGMIEALGKPGCTAIMVTPVRDRWDDVHHPSYREVWERVLPVTRDPFEARELFEPELAARPHYREAYSERFGFHGAHGVMALYPLKRLRHASRVIVAGPGEDGERLVEHVGFEHAPTVEDALAMAGAGASVAVVRYPPAVNRT